MRPSKLIINLDNLASNLREIKKHVTPAKVMAVVKANAYGHGLTECAKRLEAEGVDYLGVAYLEEALELRNAGIKSPILTLGGLSGRQIDEFLTHDIDLLASSVTKIKVIEERAKALSKKANIHIKIDTGMERVGVHYYSKEVFSLIEFALKSDWINLKGIESHLATSEDTNQDFMLGQFYRFRDTVSKFELPKDCLQHISNSGAILQSKNLYLSMVRPGRILYGISPSNELSKVINLKPVMSLVSEVCYFKVTKQGDSVSYGRTWTAKEDTRIATIPIGYGDGYTRRLSNKGEVLIRGKRYKIAGTVCMDQLMINLGPDGTAYNGDKVTLIGSDGEETITAENMAEWIGAEPLEIVTGFNGRLPREYI
jgi:alanine racemase